MMKERPILFNAEMVRAILDGRKTQTRRPMNAQPPEGHRPWSGEWDNGALMRIFTLGGLSYPYVKGREYGDVSTHRSPFGVPGERLWVRETFWLQMDSEFDEFHGETRYYPMEPKEAEGQPVVYAASEPAFTGHDDLGDLYLKHPSIHMPRWASRITLEVKRVWVERVQEVNNQDCQAEGIQAGYRECGDGSDYSFAKYEFRRLWDSIYSANGFGWYANPWVWCCEFEMVK